MKKTIQAALAEQGSVPTATLVREGRMVYQVDDG
jgi:hypothetical protein